MTVSKMKLVTMAGALAMLALAGCSTATPPAQPTTGSPVTQANFDLSKCEVIEANLYKCPAVDTPLCTPQFNRDDINCVHIGNKGSVFIQRQQM
jgi:uncharacterized protein YceK